LALILNIETATSMCSVSLALDGKILSLQENNEGQSHARVLTTLISKCLTSAKKNMTDLEAISVSKGPGSFTGLRIGVASAKGLCYALNIPMLSVNTLQSMAAHFIEKHPEFAGSFLCPMIDARRMEVYTAILNSNMEFINETSAEIIGPGSFAEILEERRVIFFGDGMKKTIQHLGNHKNATFFHDFDLSASGMVSFSERSYSDDAFESIVTFEPFYLKYFYSPRQPL